MKGTEYRYINRQRYWGMGLRGRKGKIKRKTKFGRKKGLGTSQKD